ncbi:MAG TPA: cytochrome P450 [Nocardioides sp.]|nr:cytochrome P450 [Nocardioides sp.]
MTTSTLAPLVFDPYDYALQDDPYPTYRRLRLEQPLHHNTEHDFWVLSRYADIHAGVRDDDTFSNAMGVTLDASAWSPDAHKVMSFLAMDPPETTRLRRLVSKGFTPRRVRELGPDIQRITDLYLAACLEKARSGEEFCWIKDFAGKVPMDVISEMLGVPDSDRDEVRRLADLLVHREHGVRDVPPAGVEAAGQLFGYYNDLLAEKRRHPGEDLTSALLHVEDDGKRMTRDEIIAFLFLTVVAGNETTTKLLGNALGNLSRVPSYVERVFGGAGDASLVGPWVEETLRYDASTQILARQLRTDLTRGDVTAPAGAKILLLIGAANHDESVFCDPDTFDLDRPAEELDRLVSFGGGRHFCLGANLARLEAKVALASLVAAVDDVEVDHDRSVRFYSANVRGFAEMPVRVSVR